MFMNFYFPQFIQVPIHILLTLILIIVVIVGLASSPRKFSRLKLLFGLSIGVLIGILINKIPISSQSIFVLQATVTGAIGGFLYSMQSRKLERPKIDSLNINPGFLVDCLTGVAGAYILFLLIPGEYRNDNSRDTTYLIKILALGLIGGYSGRNLLDVAVDRILSGRIDGIKQQVDGIEQQVDVVEIKADQNQVQIQANNEAKALLDVHFGRFEGLNLDELEKLNKSLKAALPEVRSQARLQAQNICEEAEKNIKQAEDNLKQGLDQELNQELINKNEDLIQRAIQVFEILIAIDREDPIPNTHGQLGYALKLISNWNEAERQFTNAIQIIQNKGSEQPGNTDEAIQKWCEYQRAICRIKLGKINDAETDLRSANQDQKLAERIKNDSKIKEWLTLNGITL